MDRCGQELKSLVAAEIDRLVAEGVKQNELLDVIGICIGLVDGGDFEAGMKCLQVLDQAIRKLGNHKVNSLINGLDLINLNLSFQIVTTVFEDAKLPYLKAFLDTQKAKIPRTKR